jgi:hypothetical protein
MKEDQATGDMEGFLPIQVFVDQKGVHSVQTEDDQPVDMAFFISFLSSDETQKKAERPGKKRKYGQEKGQKEDEKGGQKGETGARTDVGTERDSEQEKKKRHKLQSTFHNIFPRIISARSEIDRSSP